jgi:cysteinyl-tRNA synthetase
MKKSKVDISEKEILSKIEERKNAKSKGNFQLADKIREDLQKEGIVIEDKKDKTEWKYK